MSNTRNLVSTITFRVDSDLKEAFDLCAKANDRPTSLLLRDFMREYIKQHGKGDFLAKAKNGALVKSNKAA